MVGKMMIMMNSLPGLLICRQYAAAMLQFLVSLMMIVARCCCWQLHFVHEKFNELHELHKSALPEDEKLLPWDLHVPNIKQVVVLNACE